MLKDKIKRVNELKEDYYGICNVIGYEGATKQKITKEAIKKEINHPSYYFAEIEVCVVESDYHTFMTNYYFRGVYLAFALYSKTSFNNESFNEELIESVKKIITEATSEFKEEEKDIIIEENVLKITLPHKKLDHSTISMCEKIAYEMKNHFLRIEGPQLKKELLKHFDLD